MNTKKALFGAIVTVLTLNASAALAQGDPGDLLDGLLGEDGLVTELLEVVLGEDGLLGGDLLDPDLLDGLLDDLPGDLPVDLPVEGDDMDGDEMGVIE